MGYQRHRFDKEKRASNSEREESPEQNISNASFKSRPNPAPQKPKGTKLKAKDPILKKIKDYTPPSNDPLALELGGLIEQYSHAFLPIHFSTALQALAMDSNQLREHVLGRRATAKKMLGALKACTSKFSMQENASILKNLFVLELAEPELLKPFLRRAVKDARYYSILEISQCARALARSRILFEDIPPLITRLFQRATEIFHEIDDDSVVHFVEHLGERQAYYTPFTDLVTERVLQNGTQFSIQTLGQLCRGLTLSNSLSPKLHAFLDQRVTNLASPKSLSPFSFDDARGLARCIRALETSGWRCSVSSIKDFVDALQDHWQTYQYDNQLRLVREIAPVLYDRDLPIPDAMKPLLSERLRLFRAGVPSVSAFESSMTNALEIAGANFEYSVNRLCYELDFLITTKTGRLVNLESDGDVCHAAINAAATTTELELEPLVEDIYRDKVLSKSGISVVRILYSTWRNLTESEQAELLRKLIPDL